MSPATPLRGAVPARASANFALAKVLAIFMVVAGHWFGGLLWIPVSIGLFIFAFSSGYFTARIYGGTVDRRRFWHSKFERLGLRYWVLLSFLALLFACRGRTIVHWHTLVHYAGLSGALNWAGVANQSALGGGLWFFTLLLLFYASYPYLARLAATARGAATLAVLTTVAAIGLEMTHDVGHELWLTALAFIAGVCCGQHTPRVPTWASAAGALLALGGMLVLSALHVHVANVALLTCACLASARFLVDAPLPTAALAGVARLDKLLLEIFLIHTALFVHPTGTVADFGLSVALIVAVAWLLNRVVEALGARVLAQRALAA